MRLKIAPAKETMGSIPILEGNPALMNLRMLQSLATAQSAGNTLVVGMPCGFVPLKNGKTNGSAAPATEG